jgi:hypothetical protein
MPATRPAPAPAYDSNDLPGALNRLAVEVKDLMRRIERAADKAVRERDHNLHSKYSRLSVALSDVLRQLA